MRIQLTPEPWQIFWFQLEAENRGSFTMKVSPLMLVNTLKQGEISNGSVRPGTVERLFESERDPLVEFGS